MSNQSLPYRIGGIDVISCQLAEPTAAFASNQKMNFNLQLKHQVLEADQAVAVLCTIRTTSEASGTEIANFTGRMTFAVDEMTRNEQGQVSLSAELMSSLNGITVSTMRGVMWATFKGTYAHRAVLPVIHPEGFLPGSQA